MAAFTSLASNVTYAPYAAYAEKTMVNGKPQYALSAKGEEYISAIANRELARNKELAKAQNDANQALEKYTTLLQDTLALESAISLPKYKAEVAKCEAEVANNGTDLTKEADNATEALKKYEAKKEEFLTEKKEELRPKLLKLAKRDLKTVEFEQNVIRRISDIAFAPIFLLGAILRTVKTLLVKAVIFPPASQTPSKV